MKLTADNFERLTECQMEFSSETDWIKQADRFVDGVNWSHSYIYWVENYPAALLACEYLTQIGFDSQISYDNGLDQYVFTKLCRIMGERIMEIVGYGFIIGCLLV
jgi:hypothetical protein